MTVTIQIRNEKPADYRQVEAMTQRAFWNLYGSLSNGVEG
uniref:Uncharacterized protein n=1 Tax=Loigolactobacillus rennini TaxID=238013 RepID=A0A1K2I4R1_9LACO|nr:hypothetical protein LREN565_0342 [Loigolactobacillus rennini]